MLCVRLFSRNYDCVYFFCGNTFFEIRIEFESNIYRIFCFFDEGNLVILINGFQKKTQKTPKSELELAKKLKKQYFIDKKLNAENEKGNSKKIKR